MTETRTVHDPFTGVDVQVSDRLVDRLRGKYASGPQLPNGEPEFGWRQFETPPIQHAAAARIEALEAGLKEIASSTVWALRRDIVTFDELVHEFDRRREIARTLIANKESK